MRLNITIEAKHLPAADRLRNRVARQQTLPAGCTESCPQRRTAAAPEASRTTLGCTIHGCRPTSAATQPTSFAMNGPSTETTNTHSNQRLLNSVPRQRRKHASSVSAMKYMPRPTIRWKLKNGIFTRRPVLARNLVEADDRGAVVSSCSEKAQHARDSDVPLICAGLGIGNAEQCSGRPVRS